MRLFLTGGAGFIGARFAQFMARDAADQILVYDNLSPQVHGDTPDLSVLPDCAEVVRGDVQDAKTLSQTIERFQPTVVAHLASETGTGQSYHELTRYLGVNVTGTGNLLEALRAANCVPECFLLTSTRAVYGEGPYRDSKGVIQVPPHRSVTAMEQGEFRLIDAYGEEMEPMLANHMSPVRPISVYGSTKLAQEHIVQNVLGTTECRVVTFRFQNVYGAGQSLINPYTGVLSHFISRLASGQGISIFEDGRIARDFVHVNDVVSAMHKATQIDTPIDHPIDIGSGQRSLIRDVAQDLARLIGVPDADMPVTGAFRVGDVRNTCADISYAREVLGWQPETAMVDGLENLWSWARDQTQKSLRA